jgi:hypothetical protein
LCSSWLPDCHSSLVRFVAFACLADLLRGHVWYPCLGGGPWSHEVRYTKKDEAAAPAPEAAGRGKIGGEECDHDFSHGKGFASYVGLFTCPHGYIYGGFLSPTHESLDAFYQCFATRLLPVILKLKAQGKKLQIVYDSACQIWPYIANRHPALAACIQ